MPAGLALDKVTVNGIGAVTVAFLCRVPDKRHSANMALPIKFLPCVLCRVPHSAKALPSAIWPQALGKEPEFSSGTYAEAVFGGQIDGSAPMYIQ